MTNCLVSPINWADDSGVELSGGSWSPTQPLAKLRTFDVLDYARSTSAAKAATKFRVDFGSARRINAFGLLGLNVSADALIRVRASNESPPPIAVDFVAGDVGPFAFARASTATYYDADGILQVAASGVPRFDHNPATGEPLGVLVEAEARTNLIAYSKDGSQWTPQFSTTIDPDAATAPDGTATFAKLIQAGAGAGSTYQGIAFPLDGTPSNSTPVAFSVTLKSAGVQWVVLRPYSGANNRWCYFDLVNGVVGNADAGATGKIVALGDGRFRCSVAFTTHTSAATANASLWMAQANGTDPNPQFVGNGTSGILVADVQWEECQQNLVWPSSIIPTAGAAATRAAELLDLSGSAFSALVAAGAGTMAAVYSFPTEPSAGGILPVASLHGSGSRTIRFRVDDTATDRLNVIVNPSSGVEVNTSISSPTVVYDGTAMRSAVAWNTNDVVIAHDGTVSSPDTSVNLPTLNRLILGADAALNSSSIHIRWFAYWPSRLADALLAAGTLDEADFAASEDVTDGWVDAYPTVHVPVGGYIPFGRASSDGKLPIDERPGEGTAFYAFPSIAVDARYVTVEIDDEANADGYVQASFCWIGYGERPSLGIPVGELRLGFIEEARRRRSLSGAIRYRRLWMKRTISGALRMQDTATAFRQLMDTSRRLGGTRPVLMALDLSGDGSGPGVDLDRLTIIGTLEEPPPVENETWSHYGWPFAVTGL